MTRRWRRAAALALASVLGVLMGPASLASAQAATPSGNALVIGFDVSRSVDEADFQDAKLAAAALIPTLPPDIVIGLLVIGTEPRFVAPLGSAPEEVVAQLGTLERDPRTGVTPLFDSVELALDQLEGFDRQQLLLFTDGQNDAGQPDVEVVMQRLADSGQPVVISAVFVNQGDAPPAELERLTGGSIYQVNQGPEFLAQITDAFRNLAEDTGLTTVTPPPPSVTLTPSTTSATLTPTPTVVAAPPPPPDPPALLPDWTVLAAAVGAFVGLLAGVLGIGGLARRGSSPQARRQRGLEAYTLVPRTRAPRPPAPPTRLGDNPLARGAVALAEQVVRSRNVEEPLARRLEAANLPLRPGEWVILQVAIALLLGLLLLALSSGNPLALLAGVLLGAAGAWFYLSTMAQRRRNAFHAVLPDTLGLLASTLRVGYSLPQAMTSVVEEGREPIRTEFNHALVDARLGMAAEAALEGIADRVDSDDFRWVVMAIRIQREVGGNLAELLDTVAETMRDRARLRRQVNTLSAEGRISAWVIGGLPVVFVVYLLLVRPEYLSPLVTDPLGLLLLALAAALFAGGVVGLRWAIKVDV